jgi:hypothetical protein
VTEQGGPPPQAVVMQMMMAAWTAQTIATVAGLGVPDLLRDHGPCTARDLTERHGVDARSDFLERALRACASVGVFTESADGRFGPTPLSEVLTVEGPGSIRRFVELIGGRWWALFAGLGDTVRTGRLQDRPAEPHDPRHTEKFGEAMKSRVASTRGVLEHGDFAHARTVVDVGGGFGHLAIALLERYPHLRACVLDLPEVIAVAERHGQNLDAGVRARLSWRATCSSTCPRRTLTS